MKRVISMVTAIVLCISLVGLVSCGGSDEYEPAIATDERQNVFEDDEEMAVDGGSDEYFTGVAGDGSSIFMVGLSVSSDGTQSMLAFGNPGNSVVVLGQLVDNENGDATIYPLDGSEQVDFFLSDNGNGTIFIEIYGCEGSLDPVSGEEFMDLVNLLS